MIARQDKRDGWFRKKKYPHFDLPKSFEEALAGVKDPIRVQRHSFLPFIGYIDVKRRFRNAKSPDRSVPKKLREKIISRKERPLKYCSHMDGYIHAYYAHKLQPLYEAHVCSAALSDSVLGYRRGIGTNIHMAHKAFCEIATRQTCCAIALDIKSFFDSIDHQVLKNNLCTVLREDRLPSDWFSVYKSMTKFSWINIDDVLHLLSIDKDKVPRPICDIQTFRKSVRPSRAITINTHDFGIPQGSPLSAVFSNLYMLNFDKTVMNFANECGASYRRYSDDILIICRAQEEGRLISFVRNEISKLGTSISLSEDKTEISHFWMDGNMQVCDRPIGYLCFTFDGERRRMKDGTVARFYRRMTYQARKARGDALEAGSDRIFKRKLYRNFSHLGKANLYRYARKAAAIFGDDAPKRQLRRHIRILQRRITESNSRLQ